MENDENTELFLFVDKVGVCGGVWDRLAHSLRNVEVQNSGLFIHWSSLWYKIQH